MMRKIDMHSLVAALALGLVTGTALAHGDEDHSQDAKKKAPAAVSVAGTMGAAGVAAAPQRLADGSLFYYLTVVPERDADRFAAAFDRVGNSIRLTDR